MDVFSDNAVMDMPVTETLDIVDKTLDVPLLYALLNVFQTRKDIVRIGILTVLLSQGSCGIRHTELSLNLVEIRRVLQGRKKCVKVFAYRWYTDNTNPKAILNGFPVLH